MMTGEMVRVVLCQGVSGDARRQTASECGDVRFDVIQTYTTAFLTFQNGLLLRVIASAAPFLALSPSRLSCSTD